METKHFTILRVLFFSLLDKVFALICIAHESFLHLEHSKILEDFLHLKFPKRCQKFKLSFHRNVELFLKILTPNTNV